MHIVAYTRSVLVIAGTLRHQHNEFLRRVEDIRVVSLNRSRARLACYPTIYDIIKVVV